MNTVEKVTGLLFDDHFFRSTTPVGQPDPASKTVNFTPIPIFRCNSHTPESAVSQKTQHCFSVLAAIIKWTMMLNRGAKTLNPRQWMGISMNPDPLRLIAAP